MIDLLLSSPAKDFHVNRYWNSSYGDEMNFGFNGLLYHAYHKGRRDILSRHVEHLPFYVVIGAGLKDCAGLPGNRVYIQPNNRTRHKLKGAYPDDVFPHTIAELAHALDGNSIPAIYANNVFNAMGDDTLGENLSLAFDMLAKGGKLIITADIELEIRTMIALFAKEYPHHWPVPLVEHDQHVIHRSAQMVLVPKAELHVENSLVEHYAELHNSLMSPTEHPTLAYARKNKNSLTVIDVETYFLNHLSSELERLGFTVAIENKIYFTTTNRTRFFHHPEMGQEKNLSDVSMCFVSDNVTIFRSFDFAFGRHRKAMLESISGIKSVGLGELSPEAIAKLRTRDMSVVGAQIHSVVATKP